jgi:putative transposase
MLRVLINNAIQIERMKHLRARKYERRPERKGHANGYKPKTVKTRAVEITLEIPQGN